MIKKYFRLRTKIYNLFYPEPDKDLELFSFLEKLLANKDKIKFIQIGACDGVSNDPIYNLVKKNCDKFEGLVLEPVEYLFNRLEKNYFFCKNITLLNAAVHNSKKETEIYKVKEESLVKLPEWAVGISSFSRFHHLISGVSTDYLESEKVRCFSLNEIFENYNFFDVNILIIDTEGYDYKILNEIDFNKYSPYLIIFEYRNVMNPLQLKLITNFIRRRGYIILIGENDIIAYKE